MPLNNQKIILPGGSGFVGGSLSESCLKSGYQVVILSRSMHTDAPGIRYVRWDGKTFGDWNR